MHIYIITLSAWSELIAGFCLGKRHLILPWDAPPTASTRTTPVPRNKNLYVVGMKEVTKRKRKSARPMFPESRDPDLICHVVSDAWWRANKASVIEGIQL